MKEYLCNHSTVRLFATDRCWLEGEALRQLEKTAVLNGMTTGVGLPDLHPGKGTPIGAAFFCTGRIYPFIVGNDVGCGIGLWQTSLATKKPKRDKWIKKLQALHTLRLEELPFFPEPCTDAIISDDPLLGTIGGGNHFAELQQVETVVCRESFQELGLDAGRFLLLVHSGSRGKGEALLRRHTDRFGADGLPEDSDEANQYLTGHDDAIKWARCNRFMIAERICYTLKAECNPVLDIFHNFVERVALDNLDGWLHRKGAAPADRGPLVIPGSRGSFSYLVKPEGNQALNLKSLAHGAGRKWNRKSCRDRLKQLASPRQLARTEFGGTVICNDSELLYEEAPQAYKNIDSIITALQEEKLIRVIAILRPWMTYKGK